MKETNITKEPPFIIDPAAKIGPVTLAVQNLARMVQFYEEAIGLTRLNYEGQMAELGVDGIVLVRLVMKGNGRRYHNAPGLFHLALLVPTRRDLGHWLKHYVATQGHIDGAGDHLVSEALYLTDPEGNGLEIYYDRPRDSWQYIGQTIKMDTLPINLSALLQDAADEPWLGMPTGTTMGHIHLQVQDVAQAVHFYHNILGFRTMADWSSAGFLSAGGYHHHIGVNSWRSNGVSPAPADALGLLNYTILLPNQDALQRLDKQLQVIGVPAERLSSSLQLSDPSGNNILVRL